jgi:hypothetical protein
MNYTAIDVQREHAGSAMTGLEALQSVQYVTVQGKRLAVINMNDWEALIEWLETVDDVQTAREAFAALKAAGNDRERAGWLKWDGGE